MEFFHELLRSLTSIQIVSTCQHNRQEVRQRLHMMSEKMLGGGSNRTVPPRNIGSTAQDPQVPVANWGNPKTQQACKIGAAAYILSIASTPPKPASMKPGFASNNSQKRTQRTHIRQKRGTRERPCSELRKWQYSEMMQHVIKTCHYHTLNTSWSSWNPTACSSWERLLATHAPEMIQIWSGRSEACDFGWKSGPDLKTRQSSQLISVVQLLLGSWCLQDINIMPFHCHSTGC